MSLDDAARAILGPHVSSLDGEVFALTGLPEEATALLFARYSRSRDELRPTLARLLAASPVPAPAAAPASPRARESLAEYGHPSPAEHAVIKLGIERLSILAAKAVEDLRLGSFIEKSTRHAVFDRHAFLTPEGIAQDRDAASLYRRSNERLLTTHIELMPRLIAAMRARAPRPEGASEDAHATRIRVRACDLLRGLLPAGARTGLCLTANARSLDLHLGKLLVHPLIEVQRIGAAMLAAARTVAPSLLEGSAPSAYRAGLAQAVADPLRLLYSPPEESGTATMVVNQPVRLLRHDKDALERVALALAYEDSDPRAHAHGLSDGLRLGSQSELAGLLRAALAGRGPHEAAPRGFEASSLTFELMLDYGAYRDLQRHRLVSRATQRLSCRLGFDTPSELTELGFADPYQDALIAAYDAWLGLLDRHPHEAQYAVPLGYKLRCLWTLDLRELFHVIELRSARQSHPSTRRIAMALYRSVCQVHPWLKEMIRVDLGDDALSRGG